jgi:hypothetical protein
MPAPAYKRSTRRASGARPAGRKTAVRFAAPSGDLISAIIQYADVIQDVGGHCSMLRLSERRMADPVIAEALGREAPRLAQVAVIWNDEEDQIVRVLDAAAGDAIGSTAGLQPVEDGQLELTEEALAYLGASQASLH